MSYPAPILNLNFAADKQIGHQAVSYARASQGSYYASNGLLRYASSGVPRFDHHPLTGKCEGLLLEPAVTFLDTYSEQFDNAAWVPFGTATVIANNAVNLDGNMTADTLNFPAAGDRFTQSKAVAGGTLVTHQIALAGSGTINISIGATGGTYTSSTKQIELTSKLTVYTVSHTLSAENTTAFFTVGRYNGVSSSGTATTVIASCSKIYAGTGPTSYLPTTSAGVPRAKDVFYTDLSLLKDAAGNALWNGLEGTIVMRFKASAFPSTTPVPFLLGDGTWSNYMLAFQQPTQAPFQSTTGGVNSYVYPPAFVVGADTAIRVRFNQSGFSVANDSQAILSKACSLPPGLKFLWIGNVDTGSNGVNMTVRSVQVYNRYINDADFVTL